MNYPRPLVEARLVRRYKRFLADVRFPDGAELTAHLANPGAMTTCLEANAPVRLLDSGDARRKLAWSVEQIAVGGTWICVNTARPNAIVAEALAAGRVPALAGEMRIERERALGASRADFRLLGPRGTVWVEVKCATMREGRRAVFPDARSERAIRHLDELVGAVRRGERGVLLFVVGRDDVDAVGPADAVVPEYGVALRGAIAAGVEVIAHGTRMDATSIALGDRLPFVS